MKVLYANKFYYPRGGAEKVLLDEMDLMGRQGHAAAIFASAHPENLPSPFSPYFAPYTDYFQAGFAARARAAARVVYFREAYRRFGRLIDDFKPDVVHCHNIYAQLSFSILDAARERGLRTVLTAHDFKLACPNYQMLDHGKPCEKCLGHRYYHCLGAKCHKDSRLYSAINTLEAYFNHWTAKVDALDLILCPSRFLRDKLASAVPEGKLRVVRNFVQVPPAGGVDRGYFLYAGRLSPEKGLLTLIRAFGAMRLPLVVAGTGPLEGEAREMARGLPIRFTGHVGGMELDRLYREAKVCVVPSEWYENAPLSVLEPMAYGKPVLGARIGGIPELIQDGVTGRLFEAFDQDDLARVAQEMVSRGPELAELGRAAREFVGNEFSPERHYQDLLEAYGVG